MGKIFLPLLFLVMLLIPFARAEQTDGFQIKDGTAANLAIRNSFSETGHRYVYQAAQESEDNRILFVNDDYHRYLRQYYDPSDPGSESLRAKQERRGN